MAAVKSLDKTLFSYTDSAVFSVKRWKRVRAVYEFRVQRVPNLGFATIMVSTAVGLASFENFQIALEFSRKDIKIKPENIMEYRINSETFRFIIYETSGKLKTMESL